ncbi:hypothetical protein B7494_g804 [Chlorociboria aeruginascens]|nr:hypothetical protein B7494_g804 [Chlorociboria aeruginascens]
MSIEMSSLSPAPKRDLKKHKSKSDKKHKSSHGEKKRKRNKEEDSHRSKSKKQKSDKTASKLLSAQVPETISPFHIQTASLYFPLAPISQKFPLEGLCAEHISPLILTYYPPFNGVVLSYTNPRFSEKPFGHGENNVLLQNIDEYAASWAWVTAEFLMFKPENGAWLEGFINLQNEGHIGLVCWNLFNASIERKRLPSDWKWVGVESEENEDVDGDGEPYAEGGIGYFEDGDGNRIEGTVKFRVKEIETSHDRERGFLSIEGTMLDEESEKQLKKGEKTPTNRDSAGRRLGGSGALGATSLGVAVEPDAMDIDREKGKKRYKY